MKEDLRFLNSEKKITYRIIAHPYDCAIFVNRAASAFAGTT